LHQIIVPLGCIDDDQTPPRSGKCGFEILRAEARKTVAMLDDYGTHLGIGKQSQQFAALTVQTRTNFGDSFGDMQIAFGGVL